MRVEFRTEAAVAFEGDVTADRVVDAAVRADRAGDGEVLADAGAVGAIGAGAEALGIEQRTGGGAVCPRARGIAVVEPDADAVLLAVEGILREQVIGSQRDAVARLVLQHGLAVDPLTLEVEEVVRDALRHLVDVVRARTVLDVVEPRVARLGQRAPVVFRAGIARTPVAGDELRLAALTLLVRAGDQDADGVVVPGLRNDAGDFRRNVEAAEARGVVNAFYADAALEAGAIQRTRELDVDDRADTAGR